MPQDEISTARFKTSRLDIERLNQYFEKFEFARLPSKTTKSPAQIAQTTWRVVLISLNSQKTPLPLEIYDELTIGRTQGDITVDLDLTPYRGQELGVSRLHARLQPTEETLLLFDQKSTNGTFCNFQPATLTEPQTVSNNDIITFGVLNFQLKIVRYPKP